MFPKLAEMDSPNGQISSVSNLRNPQINESLSRRRVEILPLIILASASS